MLDEFALILHLHDVYWAEDGRTSVDAVFAAVAVAGLLMMGLHPLMFFLPIWRRRRLGGRCGPRWSCALVLTLALAVVVLLKGKLWTGLLGMFIVVAAGHRRHPAVASARARGRAGVHQPKPGQDAPRAAAGT